MNITEARDHMNECIRRAIAANETPDNIAHMEFAREFLTNPSFRDFVKNTSREVLGVK